MLAAGGVVTATAAQGDAAVGACGGRQVGGDGQAGEVAGELSARIGVQEEVTCGADHRIDRDVAAIDRHRAGDTDGRAEGHRRGVGRLTEGQPGDRRGIGVAGDGGREGRASGFNRDRTGAGEAGGGRCDVALEDDATGRDRGGARVGVRAGQRQRVGPGLGERAGTADGRGEGQGVGAVEDERAVIDDRAAEHASRAARADLQRAGADRRGAGKGVGAGERHLERTELGETEAAAAVGNDAGQGEVGLIGRSTDTAVAGQGHVTGEGHRTGRRTRRGEEHAKLGTARLPPARAGAEFQPIGESAGTVHVKLAAGEHADEGQAGAQFRLRLDRQLGLVEQHDGVSRQGIGSGEPEQADAVSARPPEFQRTVTRHGMRDRERRGVGSEVTQGRARGDTGCGRGRQRSRRTSVTDLQDARRDGGRPCVGVRRRQRRGTGAGLGQGACPADDGGERLIRRSVHHQRAVIRDRVGIGTTAERTRAADP